MHYEWVFEVLDDMKAFAHENGFDALAETLEDARLTAAAEIPSGELSECRGAPRAAGPCALPEELERAVETVRQARPAGTPRHDRG